MNRDYSAKWPNITRKIDALPEAEEYKDKKDKFLTDFSEKPGKGD
jgi:ferredoxin